MPAKTALITGGSRGIGLATAQRFAQQGYNVVIVARQATGVHEALKQLAAGGAKCEGVAADVGRPDGARLAVEAATARFGRIDVLVNNAGHAPVVAVEAMSDEEYRATLAANCDATFYMTRAVWPVMTRQADGVIVNVSSRAAVDPFPGFAVYGACKAWVNTFTQATAAEGKKTGIRVFCIGPGATETAMLRGAFPDLPSSAVLAPADIAAAIEGLCDPRWAHSVGQTIYVQR